MERYYAQLVKKSKVMFVQCLKAFVSASGVDGTEKKSEHYENDRTATGIKPTLV